MTDGHAPLIEVIGIAENGAASLSADALEVLHRADLVVGGKRHLGMLPELAAEQLEWLKPLDDTIPILERYARPVVVTTGDPLWFGVGRRLIERLGRERVRVHPQISGFQHAASQLGWSLPDVATVTCHGRPISSLSHHIAPKRRIIALTDGAQSPHQIQDWLATMPYAIERFQVLEKLGGPDQAITDYRADRSYDGLNMVALTCADQTAFLPPTAGLSDDLFTHDGKMTKAEVRAVTLAKLMPHPHAVLWDVGAGSGSISLEWLRLARFGKALAIEPNAQRREMIAANAAKWGEIGLTINPGKAPDCFDGLPTPDAIFIGGGLSAPEIIEQAWARLPASGRLVANAVTLEGEQVLLNAFNKLGGTLSKIAVNRAEPVGPFHGWRPLMPVTQWALTKAATS